MRKQNKQWLVAFHVSQTANENCDGVQALHYLHLLMHEVLNKEIIFYFCSNVCPLQYNNNGYVIINLKKHKGKSSSTKMFWKYHSF